MNKRHMRLADVLFPVAGIAAMLMNFPDILTLIFMMYYTMQLFSLCGVDCYRNAVERENDVEVVNRRFGGGLAQIGIGFVICAVMSCIGTDDFAYTISELLILCAVAFILIEQLFEERMHALGKGRLTLGMGAVSALLFIAGVLAETICGLDDPFYGIILFCATGLGTAMAALLSHRAEPLRGLSFKPRNIRFFLKAGLQGLLFPVLLFFMLIWEAGRGERYLFAVEYQTVLPLCLGLIPWRLCRTVQRRTKEESRAAGFIALAAAALGVAGCAILELMPHGYDHIVLARICADTLVLAMLCSVIVFCRPGIRLCAGMALVAGAAWVLRAYIPYGEMLVIALCAVAVMLNIGKMNLIKG